MYIRKSFTDLNLRQLELMAHTIGFSREKIKYNKYQCYRNHFVISKTDGSRNRVELDDLFGKNLMVKRYVDDQIIYRVTSLGLTLFEEVFDCKCVEKDWEVK